MPGPKTAAEALSWARQAMANNRYFPDPHLFKRADRQITIRDLKNVVATANRATRYPEHAPLSGGTCWRLFGESLDGDELKVGVEIFADHLGPFVRFVTAMGG